MSNLTSKFWNDRHNEFIKNRDEHGRKNFIEWEVIQRTMFMKNILWTTLELVYLQQLPDWNSRWKPAIKESKVGNPPLSELYKKSSGNLIHTAYHLAKFEEKTNCRITDIDTIFEFGGGYGLMCKLIHTLGFKGKYTIYDLPLFCVLQSYYLEKFNISVDLISEEDLQKLETIQPYKNSLFIATWSMSEAPISMRNTLLPIIKDFSHFLIAYQIKYETLSNLKYFEEFSILKPNINWSQWEIPHIRKNYYLIGNKNLKEKE